MASARTKTKGTFCLEGDWYGLKDGTTVEPVLDLLRRCASGPYIHRDVGTLAEFDYYLQKWADREFKDHPLLYLGFHGEQGVIFVGEDETPITLDELAERLEGKCKRRVIHFGSCATLDVHGATINRFLRKTGAVAALGYREQVEWVESAAFEVLLLGALGWYPFTPKGLAKVESYLKESAPGLMKRLKARIVIRSH